MQASTTAVLLDLVFIVQITCVAWKPEDMRIKGIIAETDLKMPFMTNLSLPFALSLVRHSISVPWELMHDAAWAIVDLLVSSHDRHIDSILDKTPSHAALD